MIARRMDAFFEALYRRLEHRYLTVMRYLVLVPIYLAAAAFAVVFVGYLETTTGQILRSLAIGHLMFALVVAAYMAPGGRGLCAPVDTWIARGRPEEGLHAAWEASESLTSSGFWLALRTALILYVLVMVYATVEFSLGLVDIAVITHGYSMAVIGIVAVAWPFTEIYHRPVRRDLAGRMRDDLPAVRVRFPMGGRLLMTGSAIGVVSGAVIAYAARVNAPLVELGRLGLLVYGVGFTISALPIFLLARSLLAPVEDLLEATRRVGSGDLSTRVIVTTSDEIGVLAHSFNEMLERLERAVEEVRQSRLRIVAASDAERRRIERNIHDGAQQQLMALALHLEMLRQQAVGAPDLASGLASAAEQLVLSLEELRELARGLHPSILSTDGLRPALEQLADRAPVPVTVTATDGRFGPAVESTAYFVASEALANVAKYARATSVWLRLEPMNGRVVIEITDNGVGGARFEPGSGLRGLLDRVEAIGGTVDIDSPPGQGTRVRATLPADEPETP